MIFQDYLPDLFNLVWLPFAVFRLKIENFLSHLAIQRNVAASTQRQALNAIISLYKRVLDTPVDEKLEPARAKRHPRPPVVTPGLTGARAFFPRILVQPDVRQIPSFRIGTS